MPFKKLCAESHCTEYTLEGTNRCEPHEAAFRTREAARRDAARRQGHSRRKVYDSSRWRLVSAQVKQLDEYTCQQCGYVSEDGSGLVADHIYGISQTQDDFSLDHLQTLCLPCSGRKDGGRKAVAEENNEVESDYFI